MVREWRHWLGWLAATFWAVEAEVGCESLSLEKVADGLIMPVGLAFPPSDGDRAFALEKQSEGKGRIRVISLGERRVLPEAFLEIPRVTEGYEEGLLGMSFDPAYSKNGYLYVYYTTIDERMNPTQPHRISVLERYRVSRNDANRAEVDSARRILTFPQPSPIHNGGWLSFGEDGRLYLSIGDGGPADDPSIAPQRFSDDPATSDIDESLMGRIIRIDVKGEDAFPNDPHRNYAIPADNPYVDTAAPETWVYGFRNPWRASFDRETGDFWVGDIGNVSREEIDVFPSGDHAVRNFGWPVYEGSLESGFASDILLESHRKPVKEYPREEAACLTGGYVYRGSAIPWLRGSYVHADYAMGWVRSFRLSDGRVVDERDWTSALEASLPEGSPDLTHISAFAEDGGGELYIVDFGGQIYRIAPSS